MKVILGLFIVVLLGCTTQLQAENSLSALNKQIAVMIGEIETKNFKEMRMFLVKYTTLKHQNYERYNSGGEKYSEADIDKLTNKFLNSKKHEALINALKLAQTLQPKMNKNMTRYTYQFNGEPELYGMPRLKFVYVKQTKRFHIML